MGIKFRDLVEFRLLYCCYIRWVMKIGIRTIKHFKHFIWFWKLLIQAQINIRMWANLSTRTYQSDGQRFSPPSQVKTSRCCQFSFLCATFEVFFPLLFVFCFLVSFSVTLKVLTSAREKFSHKSTVTYLTFTNPNTLWANQA